ncbi:MAG: hypothetical protein IMY82_00955 [Chloroflexi bacterium]|nr:hypothetical protein [Chloroflexota bacterium]
MIVYLLVTRRSLPWREGIEGREKELMNRAIQKRAWEHDAIIDSSSDGLFVRDGNVRILCMNPASAEQLVGREEN